LAWGCANALPFSLLSAPFGFVDAMGSAALAHHFRHSARHDEFSERLERGVHRSFISVSLVLASVIAVTDSPSAPEGRRGPRLTTVEDPCIFRIS
jgi:hypothetical protein